MQEGAFRQMRRKYRHGNKLIKGMYFLGLIGMILLIVFIYFGKNTNNIKKDYDFENIEKYWHLTKQGTENIDFTSLGSYMDEKKGVLSLYYQIPDLEDKQTLVYRSKDVYTKVLVEGQQIYETKVYESPYYNRSPGNIWNRIDIERRYGGKCLELQVYMVYDTNAITVDYIHLGDEADIIHSIVSVKLMAVFLSILVILIGIVMIFMQMVPVFQRKNKNKGIIYLGLYAVLVGCWSLLETNVLQLYMDDVRIVQLLDNMVMIVDNLPLILYLDYYYNLLERTLVRIYAYLQCGYILLCVVMQFSGKIDLHHLLKGAWICTFTNVVLLFACTIYFCYQFIKTNKLDKQVALQLLGILALIVTTFVSATNYTQVDTMDRAQFLRVGMLFFIIFLGISSQVQTYRLMEQGLKYNFVKNLAYSDGLTGVGNRTAYLEKLEKLEQQSENLSLGIVFLDINDLKQVNDQKGHDQGDRLICSAASIIQNTYGKQGKVFRIGGDEFCVLLEGENLDSCYQEATKEFYHAIDELNKEDNLPAILQIAQGFSICRTAKASEVNKAIAEADERMYSDKRRLKQIEKTS